MTGKSLVCLAAFSLLVAGCAASDSAPPGRQAPTAAKVAPLATPALQRRIRHLITQIDDDNIPLRKAAIAELEKIGGPAVPILMETLTVDEVGKRAFAAYTLGGIGDRRAVEPIIWSLQTDHWFTRATAAKGLDRLGDGRAIEPLIRLARDPDERVRAAVAASLSGFADVRVVVTLIRLKNDRSAKVRESANGLWGLGRAQRFYQKRKTDSPQIVPDLVRALGDPIEEVRVFAVEELAKQPDKRAFKALDSALRNSRESEDVRTKAARVIGQIGGRQALESLLRAIDDNNAKVRHAAVTSLGALRDARAEDALIRASRDGVKSVRDAALRAIAFVGGPRAFEFLAGEASPGNGVALIALGTLGDPRAVGLLTRNVTHRDANLRWNAVLALGLIGDSRAVLHLIGALGDRDKSVRAQAALALDRIDLRPDLAPLRDAVERGDEAAIGELFDQMHLSGLANVMAMYDLLESPDARIRKNATVALAESGAFTVLEVPPVPEAARRAFDTGVRDLNKSKNNYELQNTSKHFREAIKIAPWWADAYFSLGLVLEGRAGKGWAEPQFEFYLALAPQAPNAADARARLERLRNK